MKTAVFLVALSFATCSVFAAEKEKIAVSGTTSSETENENLQR